MIKSYFLLALKSIRSRKLRTWLTILGIIIALTLITTLVSLGEGLRSAVLRQLRMLGDRTIYILPGEETNPFLGFGGGLELKESDVKTVRKVKGIDLVVPMFTKVMPMEYQGKKKLVLMCGHPWAGAIKMLKEYEGWRLYKGSWPKDVQQELAVGYRVAMKTFGREIPIGSKVKVGGREFIIRGIIDEQGEQSLDTMVNVDIEVLREITGEKESVQLIMAQVKLKEKVERVVRRVKNELKKQREIEDFAVITNKKVMGVVGNVIRIIEWAIIGIAAVALIVGGIGIMTTMYTSVYERTKEIGMMKAIGARNRSIMGIFLIESGLIGLLGGAIGVSLGIGIAKALEIIARQRGFVLLQAIVTPELVFLGLGFSFLIGCLSGLFPARQAAKLNPVEAIRYE